MMNGSYAWYLVIFCGFSAVVFAQNTPDSLHLPEVEVRTSALLDRRAMMYHRFDSSLIASLGSAHAGHLLNRASGAFVKDYGPGQLVTFSSRGGLPAHNTVTWQGLPVTNPTLGLTDLSLLPLFMFDNAMLQQGALASRYGSGAVSSSLSIGSSPPSRGLRIHSLVGYDSGNNAEAGIKVGRGGPDAGWTFRALNRRESNNYSYRHASGDGRFRHAGGEQWYGSGDAYITSGRLKSSFSFFVADANRDIPPALFEARSEANRQDLIGRARLELQYRLPATVISFSAAAFSDEVEYNDPLSNIHSTNRGQTIFLRAEGQGRFSDRIEWRTGLEHRRLRANSDFYERDPQLWLWAPYATFNWRSSADSLLLGLEGRADLRNDDRRHFSLTAKAAWQVSPGIGIFAQSGTHHRLPALDDLYWVPGGDPDLRSEEGWSAELGANFGGDLFGFAHDVQLSVYTGKIDDLIRWRPGTPAWSPENVAEVHSRGVEVGAEHRKQMGEWKLTIYQSHTFTRSGRDDIKSPENCDAQLIYIPKYSGKISAIWARDAWNCRLDYRYYSRIYTSDDNSAYLPGQFGLDALVAYQFSLGEKWRMSLQAALHNTTDEALMMVAGRPLPGRYFSLTANILFNEN